jgi:hypothetical protein
MAVSISILRPARYVALCWMIYTTKLWLSSSILCNLVTMTTSPEKKKKNTKIDNGNGKCQKLSDACGHLARYVALYFQHFALPGSDWVLEYFEILSQWPSPSQTPKRENQWWLGHCIQWEWDMTKITCCFKNWFWNTIKNKWTESLCWCDLSCLVLCNSSV